MKILKKKLSNDLILLHEKIPKAESASIGLWVKLGSRFESDEEKGYTHFLEHMLFKGTENRTSKEQAEDIERVGGYMNAVTSREYTYYYIIVMKSEIRLAMDILSDMIRNPLLREKDVRSEASVILEEMKSYEDSPEEFLHDFYFRNLMPKSSLGLEIIGTEKSVKEATAKKIRKYFESNYSSDRMIISAAGDFSNEEMASLAEEYFGDIPKRKTSVSSFSEPDFNLNTYLKRKKLEQVNFLIGTKGIGRNIQDMARMNLLNCVFGNGMASRLFQKIREDKGLCYSIQSFSSTYSDCGVFTVSCGTSAEKYEKSVNSIMNEIRLLKKKGISKEELEFAKSNQKGSMAIGHELPENKMMDIAVQEMFFGKYYTMQDKYKIIENITLEELNEFVHRIFSVNRMHLSSIGPVSDRVSKDLDLSL